MADPLDEAAFAEAERQSRLRLTRVTATADDIKDTLDRVWNGGGSRDVIWTGNLLSKVYASVVLGLIISAGIGGFGLLFRDALTPRFAFSLFALLCGFFFFLYALKYYVTIASVILITLFGDPAKFQGKHGNGQANGHANGNGLKADGQTNGNGHTNGQHKEGYRTLRGEKLSEAGAVVVNDPWEKMGEIRLSAASTANAGTGGAPLRRASVSAAQLPNPASCATMPCASSSGREFFGTREERCRKA